MRRLKKELREAIFAIVVTLVFPCIVAIYYVGLKRILSAMRYHITNTSVLFWWLSALTLLVFINLFKGGRNGK